MKVADEAGLPGEIMTLVDNQVTANDLQWITPKGVQNLRLEYNQKLEETPRQQNLWTFLVTS